MTDPLTIKIHKIYIYTGKELTRYPESLDEKYIYITVYPSGTIWIMDRNGGPIAIHKNYNKAFLVREKPLSESK